uniref:Uncharacterized protein n=1 Tax=Oryza brachyantha TaxID=4533 RepID=J3MCK4_ORYBR
LASRRKKRGGGEESSKGKPKQSPRVVRSARARTFAGDPRPAPARPPLPGAAFIVLLRRRAVLWLVGGILVGP